MNAITQANATAQTARGCLRIEGAASSGVEVCAGAVRVLTRFLLRWSVSVSSSRPRSTATAVARSDSSCCGSERNRSATTSARSRRASDRTVRPPSVSETRLERASAGLGRLIAQPRSHSTCTPADMVGCEQRSARARAPTVTGPSSSTWDSSRRLAVGTSVEELPGDGADQAAGVEHQLGAQLLERRALHG